MKYTEYYSTSSPGRIIFEDQYGDDPQIWEDMEAEAWTNQSHEGNGLCYCCASDVMLGKYKDNDEKTIDSLLTSGRWVRVKGLKDLSIYTGTKKSKAKKTTKKATKKTTKKAKK